MAGSPRIWLIGGLALGLAAPLAAETPPAAPAQLPAPAPLPMPATVPFLTLDQERLFTGTRFGQAVTARFETESADLLAENRRIDAALEQEERDLTDRRASMDPAEFRKLADDFDAKVEGLRAAQETKSRDLARRRDEARQQFYEAALPVLGTLVSERGAVAIVDKKALILSLERLDVTDAAIARIDEALGDGSSAPPKAQP